MSCRSDSILTHLSLFSGIGGLDLAAEWAGFTTVGQCEYADYPTKILEKHWPDVPRWRDIHDLTGEDFRTRTGLRTVDIISGGFPCQPFSVAGKQMGQADERYLFPEMLRIIADLKPHFVVGENVPGILRIAAVDIVESLEREGYECVLFDFEAAAVGAHHRRERIAFVAHRKSGFMENARCSRCIQSEVLQEQPRRTESERTGTTLADTEMRREPGPQQNWNRARRSGCCGRWPAEPDVGRVAYGVPNRMDRIRALGNTVVPAQFYPIFRAIAEELHRGTE